MLLEIVDILFFWANKGVEIFRLDAVAFMWKRLGTDSQNQPEVHDILQALRACSRIAAPAVAHKAEAIVSPDDLIHYFGTGKRYGKVSTHRLPQLADGAVLVRFSEPRHTPHDATPYSVSRVHPPGSRGERT